MSCKVVDNKVTGNKALPIPSKGPHCFPFYRHFFLFILNEHRKNYKHGCLESTRAKQIQFMPFPRTPLSVMKIKFCISTGKHFQQFRPHCSVYHYQPTFIAARNIPNTNVCTYVCIYITITNNSKRLFVYSSNCGCLYLLSQTIGENLPQGAVLRPLL